MRNRSGLVLIGAAVAILGYALVYSGISQLNPCITPAGVPVGTFAALIPGSVPTAPITPGPAQPDPSTGGHHGGVFA